MTKPPIEQAPTGWLREVATELAGQSDDQLVHTHVTSADDGKTYIFIYALSEVREELRKRAN